MWIKEYSGRYINIKTGAVIERDHHGDWIAAGRGLERHLPTRRELQWMTGER